MPLSLSLVILVLLQKHLSLNRISNVVVHALAVSDQSGTGAFCCGDNPSMGRLDTDGHSHVPVAALDDLVFLHKIPPPDLIKMDIEGGEYRALTGMITTISKYHPVLLIATHSDGLHRECIMFLEKYGYRVRGIDNQKPESTDELVAYYCSGIP